MKAAKFNYVDVVFLRKDPRPAAGRQWMNSGHREL